MDAQPRLRRATNADAEQIRALVYGVLEEYGLKPDPGSTDADLDDLEQSYLAPGGTFRVLEDPDGAVIGAYGLHRIDSDTCELRKMYLSRSRRGKGHGKRLLDDALARARELGFTRVTLETASALKEAIALYERYGFVPYHPDHLSARCDQAYILALK